MRIWFFGPLALSAGMTCDPGDSAPAPDSCSASGSAAVTDLELGPEEIEGRPFEAWAERDTAYVTTGSQGGDMLGVTLQLPGDAPACLPQRTQASAGGELLASETVPLNTYGAAGGFRTTRTLWLVFDGIVPELDSEVEVTTDAGGWTRSTRLTIAPDRHRFVSLFRTDDRPVYPGDSVEFQLGLLHAPAYDAIELELWSSDPNVLDVWSPARVVYEETELIGASAISPGTAEVIATFGDQEIRAEVTVTPFD
jgi:hypothetical protein